MGIKVQFLKILLRIYFVKWIENYITIVKDSGLEVDFVIRYKGNVHLLK